MKGATLFSGGEGVGVGMRAAEIDHLWGIELNDNIAEVARRNGFMVFTEDVNNADPQKLIDSCGIPDILHASPPCPNFSIAKAGAIESESDIALADSICEFIEVIKPKIFTLENVIGYTQSMSFSHITKHLLKLKYSFNYWILNAADYGVPQTRKRLVLVAVTSTTNVDRPTPTHKASSGIQESFYDLHEWVSWYRAIEDLIPSLEQSQLAPWQLERFSKNPRVGLYSGQNVSSGTVAPVESPAMTVTATVHKAMPKAVLVSGTTSKAGDGVSLRDSTQLAFTAVSSAASAMSQRVICNLDVLKLNTRCLARFQSFPDNYRLTSSRELACRIIGNAVPPLLYQRVIESAIKTKGVL